MLSGHEVSGVLHYARYDRLLRSYRLFEFRVLLLSPCLGRSGCFGVQCSSGRIPLQGEKSYSVVTSERFSPRLKKCGNVLAYKGFKAHSKLHRGPGKPTFGGTTDRLGIYPATKCDGLVNRINGVALLFVAWLLTTITFWTGYCGSDDFFYARYAFLLHRPPINWWEFRLPFIFALHASFVMFGPSEFTAALPNLLTSLGIVAGVTWFSAASPQKLGWQTFAAGLLAATLPLDVGFRSAPIAPYLAGGLLTVGTACLLKGGIRVQRCGAVFLAVAF